MNCPACGAAHPQQVKFCSQCGLAISIICAACRQRNEAAARFCMRCGSRLDSGGRTSGASPARTDEDNAAVGPLSRGDGRRAERRRSRAPAIVLIAAVLAVAAISTFLMSRPHSGEAGHPAAEARPAPVTDWTGFQEGPYSGRVRPGWQVYWREAARFPDEHTVRASMEQTWITPSMKNAVVNEWKRGRSSFIVSMLPTDDHISIQDCRRSATAVRTDMDAVLREMQAGAAGNLGTVTRGPPHLYLRMEARRKISLGTRSESCPA